MWLWRPVLAGKAQAHHMWDGTYTVDDWADLHEMIDLEAEIMHKTRESTK